MTFERLAPYKHAIIFASCLLLVYLFYVIFGCFFVYEDDAYIEARVIKVTSNVSGTIVSRPIHDLQHVSKGDVLYEIDKRPFNDAVSLAKANVEAANTLYKALQQQLIAAKKELKINQANLTFQNQQLKRYKTLVGESAASIEKRDNTVMFQQQALNNVAISKARIKELTTRLGLSTHIFPPLKKAKAELSTALYNLSQTVIKSPVDGYVTAMFTQVGDYAETGKAMFAIIDDSKWWVVARIKETYIERIKNKNAVIWLGTGEKYYGHVKGSAWAVNRKEEGGYQKWSVLPYLKKTEYWINLAQRFPVVIEFDAKDKPLHMGASATILIKL